VLQLLAGVDFELLGNRHVLRAFERLRIDHVGDDGLKLPRQVFIQPRDQSLSGNGLGCVCHRSSSTWYVPVLRLAVERARMLPVDGQASRDVPSVYLTALR